MFDQDVDGGEESGALETDNFGVLLGVVRNWIGGRGKGRLAGMFILRKRWGEGEGRVDLRNQKYKSPFRNRERASISDQRAVGDTGFFLNSLLNFKSCPKSH